MSPLNTGEVAVHEPTALLVNVFEEGLADEIVVVQSHKQTIRGTSRTAADVGGILPDAGMPMGEPVFLGDILSSASTNSKNNCAAPSGSGLLPRGHAAGNCSRQGIVERTPESAVIPTQLRATFREFKRPGLPQFPMHPIESSQMLCRGKSWEHSRQRCPIPWTVDGPTRKCLLWRGPREHQQVQHELQPIIAKDALRHKVQVLLQLVIHGRECARTSRCCILFNLLPGQGLV